MRLRFQQLNRSGDILVTLSNTSGIEDYAQFLVVVRNSQIVKYEFRNLSLLPIEFQYWCRHVCSLYLDYLKRCCGKHLICETDFENT